MNLWPADFRISQNEISIIRKGKKSVNLQEAASIRPYPVLEHGLIGEGSLVEHNGELEWTSLGEFMENGSRIRERGSVSKVFPSTLGPEVYDLPPIVEREIEDSANFLRTRYPDVDVTLELLKDELVEDAKQSKSLASFDAFRGNCVEAIRCPDGPRKRKLMLAFPSGELGNELNISPFTITKTVSKILPIARPIFTFDTPIRQIVSSCQASSDQLQQATQSNALAVRTFGSISLFQVRNNLSSDEWARSAVSLSKVFTVDSAEIKSGHILDMAFASSSSSFPTMWLAADSGAVYRCRASGHKVVARVLDSSPDENSAFWSVRPYSSDQTGLLTSEKFVKLFDTRIDQSVHLFSIGESEEVITSIDISDNEYLSCLSTTSEVLWLDHRQSKRPLLAWKHHRAFDRASRIQCVNFTGSLLTFLTSRNNALVQAYGASLDDHGLIRPLFEPRICSVVSAKSGILGASIIRYPEGNTLGLYSQSRDGSIMKLDFEFLTESSMDHDDDGHIISVEWSDEIKLLDDAAKKRANSPEIDPISLKDSIQVDLNPYYRNLCHRMHVQNQASDPGAILNTLEMMPDFQQRAEVDEDRVLTTFDVAFSLGDEPTDPSPSDFLTGSNFNSIQGHTAFRQNRIPIKEIASRVPWHWNLNPTLHAISPCIPDDPTFPSEELLPYLLTSFDGSPRPPEVLRQETTAVDQLALDLALSSDVYSLRSFPSESSARPPGLDKTTELLSQAAQNMSISPTELPPFKFGYLRPVQKRWPNHYSADAPGTEADGPEKADPEMPLGVRLLLSEWETGMDPQNYQYRDPYRNDPRAEANPATASDLRHPAVDAQLRMPPAVINSKSLDNIKALRQHTNTTIRSDVFSLQARSGVQSSQINPISPEEQSSQLMTSTQVLPGPYGGRAGPVKKKTVKKRLGGF